MEGGSRPDHKLGLTKRDHFHEVQGKTNPLTMGEKGKGCGGMARERVAPWEVAVGGWRGEGAARCV